MRLLYWTEFKAIWICKFASVEFFRVRRNGTLIVCTLEFAWFVTSRKLEKIDDLGEVKNKNYARNSLRGEKSEYLYYLEACVVYFSLGSSYHRPNHGEGQRSHTPQILFLEIIVIL